MHAFLQAIFRKSQYKNEDFHEYSVDLISWKRLRANNAGFFSIVICSGTLLGKRQMLSDVAQSIISKQFIPRWVSQKGKFTAIMETYNKEIGYNSVEVSFKRDPGKCLLSQLCVEEDGNKKKSYFPKCITNPRFCDSVCPYCIFQGFLGSEHSTRTLYIQQPLYPCFTEQWTLPETHWLKSETVVRCEVQWCWLYKFSSHIETRQTMLV